MKTLHIDHQIENMYWCCCEVCISLLFTSLTNIVSNNCYHIPLNSIHNVGLPLEDSRSTQGIPAVRDRQFIMNYIFTSFHSLVMCQCILVVHHCNAGLQLECYIDLQNVFKLSRINLTFIWKYFIDVFETFRIMNTPLMRRMYFIG